MVRLVMMVWRAVRLVGVVVAGIGIVTTRMVFRRPHVSSSSAGGDAIRWWYRAVCQSFDLRVEIEGEPAAGAMIVANHVSSLDIPVLGSIGRVAFLAKGEIRAWPVLGWLAAGAGNLFISRGANQATLIAAEIGRRLCSGDTIAVFPEGTTTDGSYLRRFFPRLFAAAQQPGIRVQPVALRYGSSDRPDPVAPWLDETPFMRHILGVLSHPGLVVHVRILPPIEMLGQDRRSFADHCRSLIANALSIDPTKVSSDRVSHSN